jgi:hypothetical protein
MSAIAEKERLVRNVVRLKRAEQTSPAREEIAAVRTDLERAVGPTVTRAMAARLLGVSQTALDRWIASGDVPVVVGRTDRREVPLHALVELVAAAEGRDGQTHPLALLMRERRDDAQRSDIESVVKRLPREGSERVHREAELRGLAYHRVVAGRLNPEVVQAARERLGRWRAEGRIDPRYADEWQEILSQSPRQMATLIAADNQRMRGLRQSSPFAGVLSEPERTALYEELAEALP